MRRITFLTALAAAAIALAAPALHAADDGFVVIANAPLRGIDAEALKRIYTGRMVELDGQPLRPLNLAPGQATRRRFLGALLQQSDDDYLAYWTVRRYIGKGTPPREVPGSAELIEQVQRTPGALGYIDAADLKPGMNIVFRR
jgi:ABC-type phosphate transport system substrate-binding protein